MPLLSDLSSYHFPLLYAAALYQAPFSHTKLLELMQLSGQTDMKGNPYEAKVLKEVTQELTHRMVLRQEIGLGFVLREEEF